MSTPVPITSPNKAEFPAARKSCTRVIAHVKALSVAACRAGETVALHCYTAEGEVVVYIGEAAFARACRAPHDANGVPFRDGVLVDAETRLREEAATPPPAPQHKIGRNADPDVQRRLREAWDRYAKVDGVTMAEAARAFALPYSTFALWVRANHADAARGIRLSRKRR